MKFKATLELHRKTATGVEVPKNIIDELGGGNRPAVSITINGYTYRSSIAVMGGRYLIGVSAEVRAGAHVNAGDLVEVDVQLDTLPREASVPADLREALDKAPVAAQQFETLSYSRKQQFVLPLAQAKTAETRLRRIEKIIAELTAQPKK